MIDNRIVCLSKSTYRTVNHLSECFVLNDWQILGNQIHRISAKEAEDFVARGLGLDVERAALDEVDEGELVVGEAEEVVFLGDGLGGAAAVGAGRADGDIDEGLVGDAVLAGVGAEVDGAAGFERAPEMLHAALVAGFGGADVKSSLVMPMRFQRFWKLAETSSANCCGGIPAAAAERCTFWPCSSVPVRKKVSSPSRRWRRAMTSAAMVV